MATFSATGPRQPEQAKKTPPPLGVLLVDDDIETLEEMSALLSRHDMRSTLASNGLFALQALERDRDLGVVVTDLRMPEMSGFEMIESIWKYPLLRGRILRFVVITGHGDLDAARRAMTNGAVDFISKPAPTSDIIEAVHRAQDQIRKAHEARRRERVMARWSARGAERNRRLRERVLRLGASLAKRLGAQNDGRSDFMRRMSHEFRTPLHQILGLIELLRPEDTGHDPQYIALMERAAKELLSLVDGILDLKNAGELAALKREMLSVEEALEKVTSETRDSASERSVTVVSSIDEGARSLSIDEKFAIGALRNILNNAIHFAPSGTSVTVKVSSADNAVRVSVSDTGKGMAEEEVAFATRPFWQADQSMTRRHGGAGLGLTLASLYIDLLGGRLEIDSAPGFGTTVTMTVPLAKPA